MNQNEEEEDDIDEAPAAKEYEEEEEAQINNVDHAHATTFNVISFEAPRACAGAKQSLDRRVAVVVVVAAVVVVVVGHRQWRRCSNWVVSRWLGRSLLAATPLTVDIAYGGCLLLLDYLAAQKVKSEPVQSDNNLTNCRMVIRIRIPSSRHPE